MLRKTSWSIEPTSKLKHSSCMCCLSSWRSAQHIAAHRKSVGFDEFCDGAQLKHIELVAHIFIGIGTLNLPHVPRLGAMDSWCFDSQRLESKLRIFHRVLLCIERFESIWSRRHVESEEARLDLPLVAPLSVKRPTKLCFCSCF